MADQLFYPALVRVTKVYEHSDMAMPSEIPVGTWWEGYAPWAPAVDRSFQLHVFTSQSRPTGTLQTSTVVELLSEHLFMTADSMYLVETPQDQIEVVLEESEAEA